MRGCRPSYQSSRSDYEDHGLNIQKTKQANLAIYAARVEAGLPVFDPTSRRKGDTHK